MKFKSVILLFIICFTFASTVPAMETGKIEQDTTWLKDKLDLSEEQTLQVRGVLKEAEEKVQKEHELYKGSLRALMFMDKNVHQLISKKLSTILTEEQYSKYQTLEKEENDFMKNHLQELEDKLSLTDEQLEQIVPILDLNKEKICKLKNEYPEPHPTYLRKMKKIMVKQAKQIEKILSQEQKKKFRKMRKMKEEEMRRKQAGSEDRRS